MLINLLALICSIAAIAVLALVLMKQKKNSQTELELLKENLRSTLSDTSESLRNELRHLQNHLGEGIRHQSDVLQKTNSDLNQRMDNAATVIKEVHKELGKMTNVARSIDDLQNILRAPKLRGGFGELFLGDLLAQILPAEHFDIQYRFKGGEAVDAVIYMGEKMVPVDSKFPLESFQRLISEKEGDVSKQLRRQFINDVKKHIQGVAKYIRTDEGTYDFAIMYIPAENVYYEIAVKSDVGGEEREILNYALQQKVIPVSPNTLYAYLMTIIVGLRGLQVEKNAEKMLEKMARAQKDFLAFQNVYSKIGVHLDNAKKSYEDGDKRLGKVENKLQELGTAENVPQLEGPDAKVESEVLSEIHYY